MILLIGFIALIIFIIAVVLYYKVPERKDIAQPTAGIAGVVAVLIIGFWILTVCLAPVALAANQERYDELMIYKQTVEQSTNEYVRWNYYGKVLDWNEHYEDKANFTESFWFGPYQHDVFEGTALIDFQLHGDEMPEG
jgi:4-amino-4-deoxy-L-arabinose transferase-like glycosyltransferase